MLFITIFFLLFKGFLGCAIEGLPNPHVSLQILDKVTGQTQVIEIHHQEPIAFGTLRIHVYRCHRSPPQEIPWSTAYIEVWEEDPSSQTRPVYKGWIFSSSPSTIEHPVYDIRLLECLECTTCCKDKEATATTGSSKETVESPSSPLTEDIISDE